MGFNMTGVLRRRGQNTDTDKERSYEDAGGRRPSTIQGEWP